MCSAKRSPNAAPETADRIRDAAISEFAAQGFARSTVRGIAAAAGVSAGLVIHHFGSKDGLRTACDDHVFTTIAEAKRENADRSPLDLTSRLDEEPMRTYVDYLTKSMLDPSEHGQRFFDHYVEVLEQSIAEGFAGYTFRQAEDRRAQAAMMAALGLAPLMLQQRLGHVLGTADAAQTLARLTPALFDLFTHGALESMPEAARGTAAGGPGASSPAPGDQDDRSDPDDPTTPTKGAS